ERVDRVPDRRWPRPRRDPARRHARGVRRGLVDGANVELGLKQPWVSLGSDAESSAPEGVFLKSSTHPRAYGNFSRFLGHYARDRKLLPLEQAIHRLTGLPAHNWKLDGRGCLAAGCYAD